MKTTSLIAILTVAIQFTGYPQEPKTNQTPTVSGFIDNGDGTISDTTAGLMWQKNDDGKQRSWDASLNYSQSLSLGGHSDWRLPTLEELTSLWKNAGSKDEIRKQYFPSMETSQELYSGVVAPYWSSTPIEGIKDGMGFVSFKDGNTQVATKGFFAFYCRCVRLNKTPFANPPTNWPKASGVLAGDMEVRVKNPNDFQVRVGLRSSGKGKDFVVSPNGTETAHVPNGQYDIYFNYSSDPEGLYQGDSFTLNDSGVEIQIVKVVNGNYGIRKVK